MNTAFVGFGALMGLGAILLHGRFGAVLRGRVITALLVLAGPGSAGTSPTAAGVVMAVAAAALVAVELGHGAGAVERLALWPMFVALVVLGVRSRGPEELGSKESHLLAARTHALLWFGA